MNKLPNLKLKTSVSGSISDDNTLHFKIHQKLSKKA